MKYVMTILSILIICIAVVPRSYHRMAKDALSECEKTLPRNQHCKVIAVPEEG